MYIYIIVFQYIRINFLWRVLARGARARTARGRPRKGGRVTWPARRHKAPPPADGSLSAVALPINGRDFAPVVTRVAVVLTHTSAQTRNQWVLTDRCPSCLAADRLLVLARVPVRVPSGPLCTIVILWLWVLAASSWIIRVASARRPGLLS